MLAVPLPSSPEAGAPGELSFTSGNDHENPFDVELRAQFSKDGETHEFSGFYAGGQRWKVRFCLPTAGTWNYTLTSSDDALDNFTGDVTVHPASDMNRGRVVADGRALKWQHADEPILVTGHTAYYLFGPSAPWEEVLDWTAEQGFNYLRADLGPFAIFGSTNRFWKWVGAERYTDYWLWEGSPSEPDWSRFNTAMWDRVDAIIAAANERGIILELSPKLLRQLPRAGEDRARYCEYIAARLGAWPNILWVLDVESPTRHGAAPSEDAIREAAESFTAAFPEPPLLGLHMNRNHTYFAGESGYHPQRGENHGDFSDAAWLTLGTFHERWKMEGYGILEHQERFDIPHIVVEGVYETLDGHVTHRTTDALAQYDVKEEIENDPRFYYRRYLISVLLSAGSGMAYGMVGKTDDGYERWATGLPEGGSASGFQDWPRIAEFFHGFGWNPNAMIPMDTHADSARSTPSDNPLSPQLGLNRAKLCKIAGKQQWIVYNPYPTEVTLQSIPAGLPITAWIPTTGEQFAHGETSESGEVAATVKEGDYVLLIGEFQ